MGRLATRGVKGAGEVTAGLGDGDATPMGQVRALVAAEQLFGRAGLERLRGMFSTWGELAAAPPAVLAVAVGQELAHVLVPAAPPPLPEGPWRAVGRFDEGFPEVLREMGDPPAALWVEGVWPDGPLVAVGGSRYPSALGLQVAREAGVAAAGLGAAVVGVAGSALGDAAVSEAFRAGGRAAVVVPAGLGVRGGHSPHVKRAAAGGGAAVSVRHPSAGWSDRAVVEAEEVAARLAGVVVVAEAGAHQSGGAGMVAAARAAGRAALTPVFASASAAAEAGASHQWAEVAGARAEAAQGQPWRVPVASGAQLREELARRCAQA